MARLSGLQKEVLSLYRQCLRASRKKPQVGLTPPSGGNSKALTQVQATRCHFEAYARREFEKSMGLDKKNFAAVEFLLRKGRRQLEVYSEPGIKDIK
jgi:succinate dehydrogenase assembly factor 1